MNYIRHLNAVWKKLSASPEITPHHISLYMAVFQLWNTHRFQNPLSIHREEVMWLAKIGSVSTYIRCMKQLHTWEYWQYQTSFNPTIGTKIHLYSFDNAESNAERNPTLLYNINTTKQEKGTPARTFFEIEQFFKEKNYPAEAEKFYNHYQANGWLQAGKTPIVDWQAAAISWLHKSQNFKTTITKTGNAENNGQHEYTESANKNYSEPL